MAMTVGEAFQAATLRSDEIRRTTPRNVRVRIYPSHPDAPDGVLVMASVRTQTGPELSAMLDHNTSVIKWTELEARPDRLVELVDKTALATEAAVMAAEPPAPQPPSCAGHEQLVASIFERLIEDCRQLADDDDQGLEPGDYAHAFAEAACKAAAILADKAGFDERWLAADLHRAFVAIEEGKRAWFNSPHQSSGRC